MSLKQRRWLLVNCLLLSAVLFYQPYTVNSYAYSATYKNYLSEEFAMVPYSVIKLQQTEFYFVFYPPAIDSVYATNKYEKYRFNESHWAKDLEYNLIVRKPNYYAHAITIFAVLLFCAGTLYYSRDKK